MAEITNLGMTTELEAINYMLACIGEAPVDSLDAPLGADVQMALNILRNTTREVQAQGWRFNTDFGLEIPVYDTYDSEDSEGTVTTLNVFVPPPRLVAFEVSRCPGQQGDSYPDAVLRPAICYSETAEEPPPAEVDAPVAVISWTNTAEQVITFDATSSSWTDDVDQPVEFHWNFGDGNTQITNTPTVAYQYAFGHHLDIEQTAVNTWHWTVTRKYQASVFIVDIGGTSNTAITPAAGEFSFTSVWDRKKPTEQSSQHGGGITHREYRVTGPDGYIHTGDHTSGEGGWVNCSAEVGQTTHFGSSGTGHSLTGDYLIETRITDFGNSTSGSITVTVVTE